MTSAADTPLHPVEIMELRRQNKALDDAIRAHTHDQLLPADGSRNFALYRTSDCRLKRGRIKLPGLGWIRTELPANKLPAAGYVMLCPSGDGFTLQLISSEPKA